MTGEGNEVPYRLCIPAGSVGSQWNMYTLLDHLSERKRKEEEMAGSATLGWTCTRGGVVVHGESEWNLLAGFKGVRPKHQ